MWVVVCGPVELCVCTPGVGVHVIVHVMYMSCTCHECVHVMYMSCTMNVCTCEASCMSYVCTCGTRYMCTCVCYTHDIHTHVHYYMCEYDWIHERMDQSSPIGSRGLIIVLTYLYL